MTTITPGLGSTAPSEVNTLSKAVLWCAAKIHYLQPKKEYIISNDTRVAPQPLIEVRTFPTPGYGTRASVLAILELNSDWATTTGKLWEKVKSIPLDENSPSNVADTFTPGTGGSFPATVTNYARLMAWCAEALNRVSPGTFVFESPYTDAVLISDYRTQELSEHGWLMSCRFSLPLEPNFGSLSQELYESARPVNNVSLPVDLTT